MNENARTKKRDEIVIDIRDLWRIFVDRFWIMLAAAVLVVVIMFGYISVTYTPKYESTATLYILKSQTETYQATSSDFSLALNVVGDCTFALKSHAVLDQVKDELKLTQSYTQLASSISTSNPSGTRYLQVTVKSDTPREAKRIVDRICEVGIEQISAAMGFRQANIFEKGVLNEKPCNKTGIKYYIIAGFAAAVLVYAVYLVIFLMDDSIRTDEEINQILGLAILGDIPNANDVSGQKKYKKYSKYGRYGYGYSRKQKAYEKDKSAYKKVSDHLDDNVEAAESPKAEAGKEAL